MNLEEFANHVTEAHGFELHDVGPQEADAAYHQFLHEENQEEQDHEHDHLSVVWDGS